MMASKKARTNTRKIAIPQDIPTEFELGDTAADIQRRVERVKREQREREEDEKPHKEREERERGNTTDRKHSRRRQQVKRQRTEESESEMDLE